MKKGGMCCNWGANLKIQGEKLNNNKHRLREIGGVKIVHLKKRGLKRGKTTKERRLRVAIGGGRRDAQPARPGFPKTAN